MCHAVGVKQVWAVHHTEAQTDSSMQVAPQGGPHHAFLFMSDPKSAQTTVMRLGDGMDRVVPDESCGIMFTAPTVAAANILEHTRIIQVQDYSHGAVCLVDRLQCAYILHQCQTCCASCKALSRSM